MRKKQRMDNQPSRGSFIAGLATIGFVIAAILLVLILDSDTFDVRGDYVIVGGGTAGCVLAERLSRDPRNRVYLLEAGINATNDEPIRAFNFVSGDLITTHFNKYFWQQTQDAAEVIPQLPPLRYTTGRLLGGASSVNGAIFIRGTDWMFEKYVEKTDDELWNVSNVVNAYKELEEYFGSVVDTARRGINGRLSVLELHNQAPQTAPTDMATKFATAVEQLTGLPLLTDYNSMETASRVGPFERWQVTAVPGNTTVRESSDLAFLSPDVLARPNLHVITGATVAKVLFDNDKRAYGVMFSTNGKERTAFAKKRVVLSAGINTPLVLQRSGVGNATYLESIGISPIHDNPNVGFNLYNHHIFLAVMSKNSSDIPSAHPADLFDGGAFLPNPTPNVTDPDVSPRHIQMITINGGDIMIMPIINLQQRQTGYAKIQSADPFYGPSSSNRIFVPPEGDIDHLTFMNTVKEYVCKLRDEYQGLGNGPVIDTSYEMIMPPYSMCSDDGALAQYITSNSNIQTHHWTSSARMGKAGDGISVTNSRGSVWGVTGLTLCDTSILPMNHDGTTQAPAYLVGHIIGNELAEGRF